MYVCVCTCLVPAEAMLEGNDDPMGLELQFVNLMWVLEIECQPFGRTASALSHCVISPATYFYLSVCVCVCLWKSEESVCLIPHGWSYRQPV